MAALGESGVWRNENGKVFVSNEIVQEVRTFPVVRRFDHCGEEFSVANLSMYAVCPRCDTKIKMRSLSAIAELEELFDAFIEWTLQPGASDVIEKRRAEIRADSKE